MVLLPFALLLSFAPPAGAAPVDQIFKKGARRPIQADVISEDYRTVKYSLPNLRQQQELAADQVDRILYGDAPESFRRALEQLEKGDTANALGSLKLAAQEKARPWLKEYVAYFTAEALTQASARDPSQAKAAAAEFDRLLKEFPDTRFLPRALQRWGDALARSGDAAGAVAVYDRMAQEAAQKSLGVQWEARARILKAEALDSAGDVVQAKAAYQEAQSFAASNLPHQKDPAVVTELEEIAGRAQLSEGVTLLKDRKYSEARRIFDQIALDPKAAPAVVATARLGLGQVMLLEGRLSEAMEQFARVRVEHFLQRNIAAEATYHLGQVCLALDEQEPAGKRKARDYFTEVVERYGDTPWADKARAEIK